MLKESIKANYNNISLKAVLGLFNLILLLHSNLRQSQTKSILQLLQVTHTEQTDLYLSCGGWFPTKGLFCVMDTLDAGDDKKVHRHCHELAFAIIL